MPLAPPCDATRGAPRGRLRACCGFRDRGPIVRTRCPRRRQEARPWPKVRSIRSSVARAWGSSSCRGRGARVRRRPRPEPDVLLQLVGRSGPLHRRARPGPGPPSLGARRRPGPADRPDPRVQGEAVQGPRPRPSGYRTTTTRCSSVTELLIVRSGSEMRGTPALTGRLEELPADVRNRLGVGETRRASTPGCSTPSAATPSGAPTSSSGSSRRSRRWRCWAARCGARHLPAAPERHAAEPEDVPATPSRSPRRSIRSCAPQGIDGRTGKVFLTRSWLVGFKSIIKLRDVIGIGFAPRTVPALADHRLAAWRGVGGHGQRAGGRSEGTARAAAGRAPRRHRHQREGLRERWNRISSAAKRPSTPRAQGAAPARCGGPCVRTTACRDARLIAPSGADRLIDTPHGLSPPAGLVPCTLSLLCS